MDKKALSETMVVLLIFVAAAFVLLTFGYTLRNQLKEDADIETCRLSVLAQAQTKFLGKSPVPLDCPRRKLKIFENKVEIDAKKSKKYEFKTVSEDDMNKVLAEELRLCWYKMAEGNRDVFENSVLVGFDSTCLICSEIEFDEKLKNKNFAGLLEYINSTKIPKESITYFDYLVRFQRTYYGWIGAVPWAQYTPWGYGTTDRISEDKVDTNQKYLIYFLAHKSNWLGQITQTYTSAYYIGLGKEDKRKEECTVLVN